MKRAHTIPLSKRACRRGAPVAVIAQRWKPLTLTWRKSLRPTERRSWRSSAAIGRNTWSPRFQLRINLAVAIAARAKAIGPAMLRSSSTSPWLSQTRLIWLGATSRSLVTNETRRRPFRLRRCVASHKRTICSWSTLERQGTSGASTFSSETKKISGSRALPSTVVRSSSPQRPAQGASQSIFSQASDTVHWLPHSNAKFRTSHLVQSVASSEPAHLTFARGGPAPAGATRPPELVWRTEARTFAAGAIERSIGAATSPVGTFVTPSATHFQPSRATVETVPAQAFDAALMDRLAEDVMGRVERRIRIERERRGV